MSLMRSLNQFLKNRNGRWHYCRRVPAAFEQFDKRGLIRTSLKTSSLEVARVRRDALAEADEHYWSSLSLAGDAAISSASARYRAARKRAMARGFVYTPVDELASVGALEEILTRLKEIPCSPIEEKTEADALLGAAKPAAPPISEAFEIYHTQIAKTDLIGKSDEQKANWKKIKLRVVNNFIGVCGDLPMDKIGRQEAQEFRSWWGD